MPIATMACVAQATGVSLDWLATGNGSPTPFAQGAPPASGMAAPTPGGPRPPPAIGRLNPLVLAKAMEVVEALSPTERGTLSMLERARRVIHVYELLITPEEDLPPLPMVPSASDQGGL